MIYTLTLNPAIDNVIQLPERLNIGHLNRALYQKIYIGGKGINVSRMLSILGRKSTCLGFVGGFTGEYIAKELNNLGIDSDFVYIKETTRINTKVLGFSETEINGPSPKLNKEDINKLFKKISTLTNKDIIIISGAVPRTMPITIYLKILDILHKNKVTIIIDTNGAPLVKSLRYHPFLIKPNRFELEMATGVKTHNDQDIIECAKELINSGAENVLVSLGRDGAIFVNKNITYKAKAIRGKVVNSVGGGDSAVAGFVDEFIKSNDFKKAVNNAMLIGSATAFSFDLADKKMIASLKRRSK